MTASFYLWWNPLTWFQGSTPLHTVPAGLIQDNITSLLTVLLPFNLVVRLSPTTTTLKSLMKQKHPCACWSRATSTVSLQFWSVVLMIVILPTLWPCSHTSDISVGTHPAHNASTSDRSTSVLCRTGYNLSSHHLTGSHRFDLPATPSLRVYAHPILYVAVYTYIYLLKAAAHRRDLFGTLTI